MRTAFIFVIVFLILLIVACGVGYFLEDSRLKKCLNTESPFCPTYMCSATEKAVRSTQQ